MAEFKTKLFVEQLEDVSAQGRGTWELTEDLVYQSDVVAYTFTVPKGFITDFTSVPRVPLIFDWLGDRGNLAGTLHDFLYSRDASGNHQVPDRLIADKVLKEALVAQGVGNLAAWTIYLAVRLFGNYYWNLP